jgi:AbrB family looped-hinge helix DNA binding protein
MESTVTSKFQTTIPKNIREQLNISVKDTLDWKIEKGKIVLAVNKNNFLAYKNTIEVGPGSIEDDIRRSRKLRMEKYR